MHRCEGRGDPPRRLRTPRDSAGEERPDRDSASWRQPHAAAKLAHDFFPGCGVFGDICEIERVEHQPCRLRALVMASHTVLIDEGALLRKSGSGKHDYEQETAECEPQITP